MMGSVYTCSCTIDPDHQCMCTCCKSVAANVGHELYGFKCTYMNSYWVLLKAVLSMNMLWWGGEEREGKTLDTFVTQEIPLCSAVKEQISCTVYVLLDMSWS